MSHNATRYARTHFTKNVGFHSAASLGLSPADLAPVPVPVPERLPAESLARPDLAGRMPIAYAGGRYIYDEVNVVCAVPAGRGRVRYERWIVA